MPSIFTWNCSHYINSTRKWTNGSLYLRENDLLFAEDSSKSDKKPWKFSVKLNSIVELRKATSTLIYRCLVVSIKSQSLWFSTFMNLDDVIRTIEYFRKEKLCANDVQRSASRNLQHGNELVRIIHGTQDTLMEASKTLHAQGRQLNTAAVTMNMIHNDLTVAERISDDLDAYLCSWQVKSPPTKVANLVIERPESSEGADRIEYSVLYASIAQESHKHGYMVLNDASINLLDEKSTLVFASHIVHLSDISVNSPWDIFITKRSLGKADVSWHLISTRMPELIQTLRKVYNIELNYGEAPDTDENDDDVEDIDIECNSRIQLFDKECGSIAGRGVSDNGDRCIESASTKQLSHEDGVELSKVLNNIKSMAMNIGVEQDAQLKQLDELNKSVDRADARIHSTDKKVKKLL